MLARNTGNRVRTSRINEVQLSAIIATCLVIAACGNGNGDQDAAASTASYQNGPDDPTEVRLQASDESQSVGSTERDSSSSDLNVTDNQTTSAQTQTDVATGTQASTSPSNSQPPSQPQPAPPTSNSPSSPTPGTGTVLNNESQYFGPASAGLLAELHANPTVTHGNTGSRVAIGIRYPGSRIEGFRVYHAADTPPAPGGPNGYSNGDGGVVKYKVYADGGGFPVGPALATTPPIVGSPLRFNNDQAAAASRYPGAVWTQYGEQSQTQLKFRRIDFTEPLSVAPGTKLWVVHENVADVSSNYTRPDWNNSVSWDFTYSRHVWLRPLMDDNFDAAHEFVALREQDGTWINRSLGSSGALIAIAEVFGDRSYGHASYGLPTTSDTGDESRGYRVDGTRKVRQTWTPSQDMEITKFGLVATLLSGSAPIQLTIRQNGQVVHTASITGFPSTSQSNYLSYKDRGAVVIDLPSVRVDSGAEVKFEMSTASGTVAIIGASKDGTETGLFSAGGFAAGDAEYFDGGQWIERSWLETSSNWVARPQ